MCRSLGACCWSGLAAELRSGRRGASAPPTPSRPRVASEEEMPSDSAERLRGRERVIRAHAGVLPLRGAVFPRAAAGGRGLLPGGARRTWLVSAPSRVRRAHSCRPACTLGSQAGFTRGKSPPSAALLSPVPHGHPPTAVCALPPAALQRRLALRVVAAEEDWIAGAVGKDEPPAIHYRGTHCGGERERGGSLTYKAIETSGVRCPDCQGHGQAVTAAAPLGGACRGPGTTSRACWGALAARAALFPRGRGRGAGTASPGRASVLAREGTDVANS